MSFGGLGRRRRIYKMFMEGIKDKVKIMTKPCPQCGYLFIGIDICSECHGLNERYHKEIIYLLDKGHTGHCAQRIVYGDGECECGNLIAKIDG